ncbi:MAG: hypothetical protein HY900_16025 [Deltaproteobacteria bacterium]|nr:hypothetical protein [Deltaproteobacteria bacterium]
MAVTKTSGSVFVEETRATSQGDTRELFQAGVNVAVEPPLKKQLRSQLNVQLNFTQSEDERIWNLSPFGNLGLDLSGEAFALNLQHSRTATVTTAADLVETRTTGASLSLSPKDWPRIFAGYSTTTTRTGDVESSTDSASVFADYTFRWLSFRGGLLRSERQTGDDSPLVSDTALFGVGGSYEVLPRTVLTGDYSVTRFASEATTGEDSVTVGTAVRLGVTSSPLRWLGLSGSFAGDVTAFQGQTSETRSMEGTANVNPSQRLRLSGTVGNRRFDDAGERRSVDYTTLAATYSQLYPVPAVELGLGASRTYEWDPGQGDNVRDNLSLNATMDVSRRASLRGNLGLSRTESVSFVSNPEFDASGPLADRALFDDRPAGFTFFDTEHQDLYTKLSAALGDWSQPVHLEQITQRYSVARSFQLNLVPTDRTSVVVFYSSNSSGDELDLGDLGSQTLNGSLSYQANLRTAYGLSGNASFPASGETSYSATGSLSYRLRRGHQLNVSYGRRVSQGSTGDNLSANMRFVLPKRLTVDISYSASQLFDEDQTTFLRARASKSF